MKTIREIVDSNVNSQLNYTQAVDILNAGEVVAFPTETVYGLGAVATDDVAVKKIFEAKGRPSDNPLIVHIGTKEEVELYIEEIPEVAKKCMDLFWPGPLTLGDESKTKCISKKCDSRTTYSRDSHARPSRCASVASANQKTTCCTECES